MPRYEKGQWNVICDRCGHKYKARQLCMEWTGLKTCRGKDTNNCWEPRHPQDSVRGVADKQVPPWTRPEAPEVFVDPEEPPDWDDL